MKAVLLSVLLLLTTRVAAEGGTVGEACREVLKADFRYDPASPAATPPLGSDPAVVKMARVIVLAPRVGRELERTLENQTQQRAAAAAADFGNFRLAGVRIGITLIDVGFWWNPIDEHIGLMKERNLGVKAELIRIRW